MENRGAERADDLEIASIGSLYVGPWDKKYWSCTRGKDRYPYPVGYHAIRTHAGNVFQMEVCEGLKGPLFVITAVDGSSFNGQTPDIAWENYQKNCPKLKNWNVKRLSNKIDGSELFGFKNPSIQRLLRELVNTAEGRSLFSPFFCNGSKNKDQICPQVSDQYSSLVSAFEEKRCSRKRIRKKRNARNDIMREARSKKICPQGLQSNSKTCILQQMDDLCYLSPDSNAMQLKGEQSVSHNEDSANDGIARHHRTSPNGMFSPLMHLKSSNIQCQKETEIISFANGNGHEETNLMMQGEPELNCHSVLASKEISIDLDCSESVVDKHIVSHQNNCVDTETSSFTIGLDKISNAVKIMLHRCPDGVNERSNPVSSVPKGDCEELMALASLSDVYISDTCDTVIDNVAMSALDRLNEIPSCMKNELVALEPLSRTSKSHSLEIVSKSELKNLTSRSIPCGSEPRCLMPQDVFYTGCILEDGIHNGVAKDSLPEVGSSGSTGQSFEDVDLDLAGQELAKSMMTFLLPRAVPLLKKTYVRRRSRARLLEANDPCCILIDRNSADPKTVNDHLNNILHQGKLVAGTLAQLPEKTIDEVIDASKTLSRVCSSCDFISSNLHLVNDTFSGNRCSKDLKSVIPDSFENDVNSYSASMKEQPCVGFHESDISPQNDVKRNSYTSNLLITDADEVNELVKCFSQNDAYNLEVLSPGRRDDLADLMITVVEPAKHIPPAEETNAELIKKVAKNANHLTENLNSLDAACVMQSSSLHFNHESKHSAEEENFQVALGKNPIIAENFEQNTLLCHILDNLIDNEVSEEVIESHNSFGSVKEKHGSYSPIEVVNFGMHGINNGEPMSEKDSHSSLCMPKGVLVTGGIPVDTIEAENFNSFCNAPLSETIVCQDLNKSDIPEMNSSRKSLFAAKNYQSSHMNYNADSRILSVCEVKTAEPKIDLRNIPNASELEANWLITAAEAFQSQELDTNVTGIIEVPQANRSPFWFSEDPMDDVSQFSKPGSCSSLPVKEGIKEIPERSKTFTLSQLQPSYKNPLVKTSFYSEKNSILQPTTTNGHKNPSHDTLYRRSLLDGSLAKSLNWNEGDRHMELVGCYLHPEPVLSILLIANRNQLQLSILCGFPDRSNRYIFMYALSVEKQRRGCPSFLGYTPLLLPFARNRWNRNISFERSALQLTPDGQSLIFVNSIKVPRCREQKISCLCSECKSESSKETSLDIVHVKFGYVSSIKKLITGEGICCISVCEPNYLVAVEEKGGLHVWVMNLTWSCCSENLEEFMLPTFDHISPTILELKRVPNYDSLIIGHNGLGDFGIWEISKRVFLAKFSSPGSTAFQIIPISVFHCQVNATFPTTQSAEHIMESMQKTNCEIFLGSSFEDMAIWILISTAPDLETQLEAKGLGTSPAGLWRLALMTKNMIIMGNILDPRATAVDASGDNVVIGTSDGLLYKWELTSGRKLGNLSSIQCGVSCVALDGKSGALAVADKDGKLQVFIEP
ncbi:uncharacterized protein LOC110106860 isoform X3 [Dendrobium catenatum]|uniref:uncharacterized protein LOC110106860 isoform X3 n=1 Tax=Dendrobium catenatum TaxID=906689 RepID=UPI00109FC384|nr:uncharacterized protein LOC110106860 isoform X3 [Dendrobium catenatum]